jgi:hypothetical protein
MFLMSLALLSMSAATPHPKEPSLDVSRAVADVRRFASSARANLWQDYGKAPFGFLLVSGDQERLFCQEPAPPGFRPAGRDGPTGCSSYARPRSGLPDSLLAAMPVFGPPSTIVMGTPETTGRSNADWTRTVLHEHFHQWQDSLPNFYDRAAALGLAGPDNSGMWMLNYPFPYSDARVVASFNTASHALGRALDARGTPTLRARFADYLSARRDLAETAGEKNWRYAEFELWKEGVARWTEIQLGKRYPDQAVRNSAIELENRSRAWLNHPDLAGAGREFVYPFGAGEAALLEFCMPSWRREYPKVLALGPLLEKAHRTCVQ